MSRTRKGSKPIGYDYWSKRAGNNGSQGFGKAVKKRTAKLERNEDKEIVAKALQDKE